eukprot:c17374_g1_i1 orf=260-754(-)
MNQSSSLSFIDMADPVHTSPRPVISPLGLPPLGRLPFAADELLRRVVPMVADFVDSCAINGANQHYHPHHQVHSQLHHESRTNVRTPKLSVLGFASLLMGISSTLMLFGSVAFFLGFMLMPLIVPACVAVGIGALLATVKEGRNPTSMTSVMQQGSKILQEKSC